MMKNQSYECLLSDMSCFQHELFTYCDKFLNSYWWYRNINTYHEDALFIATTFEEVACSFESFLDKKKLADSGGAFLINCLLHALRFKNQQESPKIVAKVIWLASLCPPHPPELKEMLEAVSHQHFIPYIPQLILSLKLNEDYISYWILRKLVDSCPQAVFLPLHRMINVQQKEKIKDKEFKICNNLFKILTNQHSTLVFSLERILVEFVKLRKLICGKSLGVLHNIYDEVCEIGSLQFEQLQMPGEIFLKDKDLDKIQEDIDYYLPRFQELETDDLSKIQELIFRGKDKDPLNLRIALYNILSAIKFIEKKFKHRLGFHCIGSEFLSTFHHHNNTTELFFDSICMNEENTRSVKIVKFLPFLKIIKSFHGAQCKIFVMNEKGKVLPFVLRFDSSLTKYNQEQLVYQLFEFLNHLLHKENHSSQQFWNLKIPTKLSLDFQTELLISSDKNAFPLLDICLELPVETVLSKNLNCKYKLFNSYEMLSFFDLSAQQNFEIFQECVFYVDTLKLWVMQSLNAKSYILFRKQFSKDIALTGLVKYAFLLSEQYPDLMNIDKITGHVSTLGLKFANRRLCPPCGVLKEIPFRLTPMISHFITEHGIFNDVFNTMLSAARCFAKNDYYIQQFLCAIWINFYVTRRDAKLSNHKYVLECSKHVCSGIKDIADLPFMDADSPTGPPFPEDSKVTWLQKLLEGAQDIRLLFRMNPLLFPWI